MELRQLSRLGRTLFFVHLVFGLLAVGYYYQNLGTGSAIPFRGFARLFYSLNWLTLAVLEPLFSMPKVLHIRAIR